MLSAKNILQFEVRYLEAKEEEGEDNLGDLDEAASINAPVEDIPEPSYDGEAQGQ